jgi:quercetin dioxygenase-like cupin family protein
MNRVSDSKQDLEENKMSSAQPTIPPDDPKRSLTLAQLENLPHIGLVGDTYTITVTGEQTAGRFCVIDMHIPPGGGPPPHRHDFEETFILLEGQMEATFRGQNSTVRAGETLNIPANAPHQFHNASGEAVRMLCICSPAGQEKFFLKGSGGIHRESKSARPQVPHRTAKRGVDRPRGRLISKGIISARQREVVQKSSSGT